MIRLLGLLKNDHVGLALSGGVDSMAALGFLAKKGYRTITPYFFDHGTSTSKQARAFLQKSLPSLKDKSRAKINPLIIGKISSAEIPRGRSSEDYWREERYKFLNSFDMEIITAHHLNDVVETMVFSSVHGILKTIPHKTKNVIRPFLLTPKSDLIALCERESIPWIEDLSNRDSKYARNNIRNNIIPLLKEINPGLDRVAARLVLKSFNAS